MIKRFHTFLAENENKEKPKSFDLVKDANKEILILKNPENASLWVFYYGNLSNSDFAEYADKDSIDTIYHGRDEDGFDDWEYDMENYEPQEEEKLAYVNSNLQKLSTGKGIHDWEDGVDLVELNQSLSHELLSTYNQLSPKILGLV